LRIWDGRDPAVLAGDFNAEPDSAELGRVREAGFHDPALDLGVQGETADGRGRIDYILVTPGFAVHTLVIPDVWASDHRPVVATLDLPP
jgi:endonuclease/exonuclease/phosphatase family metal-dependent hydrolase